MTRLDLSKDWEVSRVKAKDYPFFPEAEKVQKLEAVSDTDPLFAGLIRYEKSIELKSSPEKAFFCAEHVYDVMRLNVNGEPEAALPD